MRSHLFTRSFLVVLFLCGLVHVSNVHAETIYATSCYQADVQAAINSASAGDTVVIPNGTCAWSSPVKITKALTLKGNGSYSVNANHEDTGYWPLTITLSGNNGIEITGSAGQYIRVTGIHFTGTTSSGAGGGGAVVITRTNATGNWRIHNCRFSMDGNAATVQTSGLGGLIDHIYSYATDCVSDGEVFAMDVRNDYTGGWAFTQPINFGSANFLFIEDSTFYKTCTNPAGSPTFADGEGGPKYVFRHNYVRGAGILWHGTESGAPLRGGYAFEVYNNEFYWTLPSNRYHTAIFDRGGTALIHNNTVTNYQYLWKTWVRRSTAPFGIFGQCNGTQVHDGNFGGSYPPGYPCLDQCGRGKASHATLSQAQPQEGSKSYIWSNTRIGTSLSYHNNPTYVVQGRDYEISDDNSAKPANYTPYPYPHPLASPNPAPAPPSNLKITGE